MRQLTLDEKINLKSILSRYNIAKNFLCNIKMIEAIEIFYYCTGKSIAFMHEYIYIHKNRLHKNILRRFDYVNIR